MSPQHRNQPAPDISHRARAMWTVLGRWGRVALVLVLLAAVVLLIGLKRVAGALMANDGGSRLTGAGDEKEAASKLAANFENNLAQINGRSMFLTPPAPRKEPVKTTDESDGKPPPPPSRYGGPSLVGFAHDTVFFNDGRRMRVGDDSDKTLKILRIDAPWSATVVWENVEFTVGLFDKDKVVLSKLPGEKPTEGDPAASSEQAGFVGPPKPSDETIAAGDEPKPGTPGGPETTPTPEPRTPAPQDKPQPDTNPPKDGNGARQ